MTACRRPYGRPTRKDRYPIRGGCADVRSPRNGDGRRGTIGMPTNGTSQRPPREDEKHRREMRKFYRSAAFFLQIGWSVITPIVLFPWLGSWLSGRFSLGTWPIVVGVVLGLLTAAATFVRMFRVMLAPVLADEDGDNAPSAAAGETAPGAEESSPAPTDGTTKPTGRETPAQAGTAGQTSPTDPTTEAARETSASDDTARSENETATTADDTAAPHISVSADAARAEKHDPIAADDTAASLPDAAKHAPSDGTPVCTEADGIFPTDTGRKEMRP